MLVVMYANDIPAEAAKVTGVQERSQLLYDGLRALIARAIVALGGTDPEAWVPERRRSHFG